VSARRLIFSGHATKRMAQRGFTEADVITVSEPAPTLWDATFRKRIDP
jgi:hypothetical protein